MSSHGGGSVAALEDWYEGRFDRRIPRDELLSALALVATGCLGIVLGTVGIRLTGGVFGPVEAGLSRQLGLIAASIGITAVLAGVGMVLPSQFPIVGLIGGIGTAMVANVAFAFGYPNQWGPNAGPIYRAIVSALWLAGNGLLATLVLRNGMAASGSDDHGTGSAATTETDGTDADPAHQQLDSPPDSETLRQEGHSPPTDDIPTFDANLHQVHYQDLVGMIDDCERIRNRLATPGDATEINLSRYLQRVDHICRDIDVLAEFHDELRTRQRDLVGCLDELIETGRHCDAAVDVDAIELRRDRLRRRVRGEPVEELRPRRQHQPSQGRRPYGDSAPGVSRDRGDPGQPAQSLGRPGQLPVKFTLLLIGVGTIVLVGLYIEIS